MQDYYAILGVPSTADRDAITAAFRRKALIDHPDRGGSHEKMILLTEAWEILSDPEIRSRYDAAREAASDPEVNDLVRNDASRAKRRAEEYPRQWSEFERWLDGIIADFNKTKFRDGTGPGLFKAVPTSNTASGNLFIFVGGIIGVILLFYPILEMLGPKVRGMYMAILAIGMPFALGGWIGTLIHKAVGGTLNIVSPTAPDATPPPSSPPPTPPTETKIVAFVTCGQKLRVPVMDSELLVKCKTCGNRFALPPG